jgi:hypothetical protein
MSYLVRTIAERTGPFSERARYFLFWFIRDQFSSREHEQMKENKSI